LDFAKSLLPVKGNDTFLDLTAKQVIAMRKEYKANVRFILMNSFSTSKDTMEYLAKYPDIVSDPNLEFVQNKVHFSFWHVLHGYSAVPPSAFPIGNCLMLSPEA